MESFEKRQIEEIVKNLNALTEWSMGCEAYMQTMDSTIKNLADAPDMPLKAVEILKNYSIKLKARLAKIPKPVVMPPEAAPRLGS